MGLNVARLDTTPGPGRRMPYGPVDRGFTMLELAMVIAILGGLLAIAAPRVVAAFAANEPKIAQRQLRIAEGVAAGTFARNGAFPRDITVYAGDDVRFPWAAHGAPSFAPDGTSWAVPDRDGMRLVLAQVTSDGDCYYASVSNNYGSVSAGEWTARQSKDELDTSGGECAATDRLPADWWQRGPAGWGRPAAKT